MNIKIVTDQSPTNPLGTSPPLAALGTPSEF